MNDDAEEKTKAKRIVALLYLLVVIGIGAPLVLFLFKSKLLSGHE